MWISALNFKITYVYFLGCLSSTSDTSCLKNVSSPEKSARPALCQILVCECRKAEYTHQGFPSSITTYKCWFHSGLIALKTCWISKQQANVRESLSGEWFFFILLTDVELVKASQNMFYLHVFCNETVVFILTIIIKPQQWRMRERFGAKIKKYSAYCIFQSL